MLDALFLLSAATSSKQEVGKSVYDLVIRGARIVDGSGELPFLGDLAVVGERIADVKPVTDGQDPLEGNVVVEAEGQVLSPGFVDVHSHDDFAALLTPELPFKLLQGVTCEVVGNCGIGAAPFPGAKDWFRKLHCEAPLPDYSTYEGYFRHLEETGCSLNLAVLAGHGALRETAAPGARRPLTEAEMCSMKKGVEEAAVAGVIGLSAGLIYEPGVFADSMELAELAREMGQAAPLFAVHLRSEADGLLEAVEEALQVSEAANVGLQLSHHKAHGRNNWGRVRESLLMVDEARAQGRDVWLDQYPYAAGSTVLQAVLDRGGLSGGPALGRLEASDIVIASCPAEPQIEGWDLSRCASHWETSPQRAAERIVALEPGTWCVVHAMSEEDVETVMRHPATLIGSDGLPTSGGRPHPRLWGTFPRVLGHYCRERDLFALALAVRKMTALPAQRFGLTGRGELRSGHFADLVLFDPELVAAGSSYEAPREPPCGITGVWVNGSKTVWRGKHTQARAGRALRRGD